MEYSMSYLMKSFSVRNNSVGITHNGLYWTPRNIISIEHKVYVILPGLVWNKRYVVFPGPSRSHVDRDIPRGAPTLDGQFP